MTDLTGERTLPGIPSENYWFRRHEAAYRLAARLAPGGAVVDAGAGEGYGADILPGRVVALDLDETVLHAARPRYPRASFVRADLCAFPLRRAEAIVCLQVLEHLWCPGAFLDAAAAALGPTGVLILSTPNRETFPAGLNPSHVHEYDAAELQDLLAPRFARVRLAGTHHGAGLRSIERLAGGDLPQRLVREPYPSQPAWLRATLRLVRARSFRIGGHRRALDLIAICSAAVPSAP